MTPEELAAVYAMQSPHDLHVPTLTALFRLKCITTMEQAEAIMASADIIAELDAIGGDLGGFT